VRVQEWLNPPFTHDFDPMKDATPCRRSMSSRVVWGANHRHSLADWS
jgi:hypothetical protein